MGPAAVRAPGSGGPADPDDGWVGVLAYSPALDWAAALPEVADRLHVWAHHPLPRPEALGYYEHVVDSEHVPWADLALREEAARRGSPMAVLTDNEYDLERAGRLREDLGVPGQSAASAEAFRDKVLMKQLASRAVDVPPFRRTPAFADLVDFIDEHGYPVVVKPVKQGGSRDLSVLRGVEDLRELARRHWREDLMVEEWVEGQLHHVDALLTPQLRFVSTSRYLRDPLGVLGGRNNGSLQLRDGSPTALRLEEFTERLLGALPAPVVGAYHVEVFVTPDDRLVLCEVASRVGGSRIPELVRRSYGLDLHAAWLRSSLGLVVEPPREQRLLYGSICVAPTVDRDLGRVPAALPASWVWVAHYEVNAAAARSAATNSTSYLCYAVVTAETTEQLVERALEVEAWVLEAMGRDVAS